MINFDASITKDFAAATSREWLETNGLGGFSSSTIIGLNTRRYHGLLTAATKPPVGRVVMLSKLEETLVIDGRRYELSSNQFPGAIHPKGFQFQTEFKLDPFPTFTYLIEGITVTKAVFMVHGENTTIITYKVTGAEHSSIQLEIRPLVAFRDYHSTTHENGALNPYVESSPTQTSIKPYLDLPVLHFAHDEAIIDKTGYWYRDFQYAIEQERGLDFTEDLFSPFSWAFNLNQEVRIIASTEERNVQDVDSYLEAELARRSIDNTSLVGLLRWAADQFIVARAQGKSVIAGYHWFSDWGRDTMIALPGLLITTGHFDVAKRVLLEFAKHVDEGMLPNRFPDADETPEYNTVDATLWFFEAIRAFVEQTGDYDFVRNNLYEVLKDIIDWHVRGTRYNIHVNDDGLLESGVPGVQLTWMDAKVGDHVITPRHGKPVEIQALWYNALRVMENFAAKFNDPEAKQTFAELANRAQESFNEKFWNETTQSLLDVADPTDGSVRPNQVFAISLVHSMVNSDRAELVLRRIDQELLTPRGLRTLSPNDPQYQGLYSGNPASRDGAYHQGTVWPWLMGAYFTAYSKTFGPDKARVVCRDWLRNFEPHLKEACVGQVSEIFDGDAPHAPRGCVAQAWSVSELLRVAVELEVTQTSVCECKD